MFGLSVSKTVLSCGKLAVALVAFLASTAMGQETVEITSILEKRDQAMFHDLICDLGDLELGQEKDIIIRAENTGEYDVSFSKAEMFGSCSNFESRGTVIPSGGFLDLKLKLKTPTVLAQSGGAQNKLTLEKQEAKNQLIEVVFIFYVGTGTEVRHRSYCVVCYYRHW